MSAFKRLPVPPLPDRALGSTDELYKWAQPLLLRTWSSSYWAHVYFFLAFKITFVVVSNIIMIRLLYLGEFWIIRAVKIRRGSILVPKATDAVIFFGACFIFCDAAYRVKSIQWFRGPTYEPWKRYAVLEGLRLSPAWIAAWVHLCASSLIWPLKLDKICPLYWHLFFFGGPLLFIFTYLPPMILADREMDKAQAVYHLLERELLAAPGEAVTQWMKDQALLFHGHMAHSAYRCEYFSTIGAIWVFIVLVGELVVGTTLLSRVYKTYSQIPISSDQHETWSTSVGEVAKSLSPENHAPKAKLTPLRLAKYLAGIAPLTSTKTEVLEPLPPAAVRRILRNFFLHSLTELVCMCALLTIILSVVSLMSARMYITIRENKWDARWGNEFMRTTYIFHVTELYSVVLLCTILVASMMKRQAFPLRIKQSRDSYTTTDWYRHGVLGSRAEFNGRGDGEETREERAATNSKSNRLTRCTTVREASAMDWSTTSHHIGSDASILPLADFPSLDHNKGNLTVPSRSEDSMMAAHARPTTDSTSTEERDVSCYAGQSAGRSLVLAALASGQRNDLGAARGRKAAWRTTYTDGVRAGVEVPPSAALAPRFVTSHGHGVVGAAMHMQQLSTSPDSVAFLTADTTLYASSPTRESSISRHQDILD